MEATGHPSGRKRGTTPAWAGELIVQNGRQSGARRPLQVPLTFVGKAAGCDIRLNVDGIDPMQCLLVHGAGGLMIRDLDSTNGTFVNGERITSLNLKDGDLLTIGPFQFRLHLPPANFSVPDHGSAEEPGEVSSSDQDALRLQAAAVAAQQVALGEEEVRLLHRRSALERQEEQLASHLEDKRRKLVLINDRAQAERHALQQDRLAYEKHLEKITSDLTQAQREVLQNQEKLKAERHRLADLFRRMRHRLQDQYRQELDRVRLREEALAQEVEKNAHETNRLRQREEELGNQLMTFNAEYQTGRHQIKLGWQRLRQAQLRWRQRRGKELAILRRRATDLETAAQLLARNQQQFQEEKHHWETRQPILEREIEGLNQRIKNQRHKILEHHLEINRLDNLVRLRQERPGESTALVPLFPAVSEQASTPPNSSQENEADRKQGPRPGPGRNARGKTTKGNRAGLGKNETYPTVVPVEIITHYGPAGEHPGHLRQVENDMQRRLVHLDQLANDLADQRLLLMEQWQRLAQIQVAWESERAQITADLEVLVLRIQEQEQSLDQRERSHEQAENQLRLRYRELIHLRQHLVAWRARLKTRENGLEGERQQLLTNVQSREDLAEKQLAALVELRQRWSKRRRHEIAQVKKERAHCQELLHECTTLREELTGRATRLEEGKRELTEKALALEQYRQDLFLRGNDPGGERRLERLRRRWLTQNAQLQRITAQEREGLLVDLGKLEARYLELQKRQEIVEKAECELVDQQAAFEHKQALAAARNARLEQELQSAQAQRLLMEQQLGHMKEEVERIARQLMEESESGNSLEKAA